MLYINCHDHACINLVLFRHEDVDDVLNIQPPQITHVKKDKHRHHRHSKGDGHKRAMREGEKYVADRRDPRDDRQISKTSCFLLVKL